MCVFIYYFLKKIYLINIQFYNILQFAMYYALIYYDDAISIFYRSNISRRLLSL